MAYKDDRSNQEKATDRICHKQGLSKVGKNRNKQGGGESFKGLMVKYL